MARPEQAMERHDLVWLAPSAAPRAEPDGPCTNADAGARARLGDWIAAGHPLIVARQGNNCPAGQLRLGLALPPSLGKHRLAFRVARSDVLRHAPPPLLSMAIVDALPVGWQPRLLELLGLSALMAASPRVFGSAGMQILTGLCCVGADSDLDLLLTPTDWSAAQTACRALASLDAANSTPRVDGEVRNALGQAVAWRELAVEPRQVLVKVMSEVRMIPLESFAHGFRTSSGALT